MSAATPVSLGLPRARRVRQGREFTRAKAEGKRVVQGCLIVNWLPLPSNCGPRVGVITSRKVGNAVVRSRARRLMRETFRLHQHGFRSPLDLVLVARPSIAGKKFGDVEHDFLVALRRASLLKEE